MTTLTIAQAEASSATSGLVVADTAANIAAGLAAQPALATKVASFTLSAAGTVTAAQAEKLSTVGSKFHLGGYGLTVSDTLADISASANAAGVALATSVNVADAAYVLLNTPLSHFSHISSVTLIGSPNLSVASFTYMLQMPHFSVSSSASVTLIDTASNINSGAAGNPAWFQAVHAINVHLDSTGVGPYTATLLAAAITAGKTVTFTPSSTVTSLVIDGPAQSVGADAAALAILAAHVTLSYTLTANTVTAAAAAGLAGLSSFASHLSAVTVSDTAVNVAAHASTLFGAAFAAVDVTSGNLITTASNLLASNLQLQGATATLSTSATLTAAQTVALTALNGFHVSTGVTLTVQDTLTHLEALSGTPLIYVTTTKLPTGTVLTLTVAQADTLASVAGFTNTGATITVADTIANLQGSGWTSVATAHGVVDTAANILANDTLALVTSAAAVTLSASATITAAQAVTLHGLPDFSRGNYTLIVADTAADITADSTAVNAIASVIDITGTSIVTAAAAETLASQSIPTLVASGAQVTISDSYANIIASANSAGYALATGFTINDTAANLITASAHSWGSITPSYVLDASSSVTAAQLTTLGGLGAAFTKGSYTLTLADTVAHVLTLTTSILDVASAIIVTDTAADITSSALNSFDDITNDVSAPLTIKISDSNHVLVDASTYSSETALIDDISYVTSPTTGAVEITGTASAVDTVQTTLNADSHVGLVAVTDSVADLSSVVLTTLSGFTKPLTITLSDPTDALSVTTTQYSAITSVIDEIQNATNLQVTGTAAAVAAIATTLASDTKVDHVVVTDSAANISTNVTALTTLESKLTIDLNASGAVSVATAGLFTNAHTFTPGAFSYTIADTIANVVAASTTLLDNVASVAISDVSTNMTTAELNTLTSDQTALGNGHTLSITFTDTGKLTVTYATYTADSSVIDDITNVGAVIVTGTAAQIAGSEVALAADTKVGSVAVTDTAANINTNFTNLNTLGAKLTSITLTGGGAVSVATAALIEGVTNFTPGTYTYTIADTISDVVGATTTVLGSASGITISDVSTNMTSAALNTLKSDQTTLGSSHTLAITFSDSGTVSVTAATYTADSAIIDDVTNTGAFTVTGAASDIAALAGALAADTKVGSVVITDSAPNISAVAASLALTGLEAKLTIDLNAGGAISVATYALLHATGVTYNANAHSLSLADTAANVLALSDAVLDSFSAIAITDTASDLTSTVLGELATYVATVGAVTPTITISGSGIATFSTATYSSYSSIIDSDITNTGQVAVAGTAAQILAIASTLESDAKVGEIEVADAASTISTDLSSLLAIGSKLSVTLTDTLPITASLVPQLVQLSINNPAAITVADTGSNIAAVVESASTATTSFLDGATVDLSANAQVTAADAAALKTLTNFSLNSHTLVVYDTYSHLISSAYSSTYSWADVSGVYLNTSGGSTLTTANMLALLALPHFAATTPGGTSDSITISDTAAHFATAFATFQTDASQLTDVSYVVNTTATVTDAVLTDLQTLGATGSVGVTVTVRDTAATIAANEPTQGGISESITPAAWDLSANATVTLAQAETLGSISNFAAGSYTLTVSVPTSTVISVAQANALGALGSALVITGGGALDVQGTVSQLSALSNAALSIVTPEITDTFAHVATLSNPSSLLDGTITINDSETASAATAAAFLDLIKVGNGTGIAVGNVAFGTHTVSVNDTVSNLETDVTSAAAYTANPTLAAKFTLTAVDSILDLINSNNLTFLESVSASTFVSVATSTASQAETLALIASEIHFSKENDSLTVVDTPANLINPSYSDGITLADTLNLSADGSTNAAGAETLFENSKFSLTHTLTIEDTAANLLDGTLGTLLADASYGTGGSAVVELSTATIVDATTATELADLSGFADPNGYLTISDDPAYLIASSATAAETIAASVTIPSNETVTAATVLKLSEVPNFTPGSHVLDLAGNDVADAATLAAIGSFGTSFNHETYSITMTADDISLTPAEYNSLQSDDIVTNGHLFGAVAATPTVTTVSENLVSKASTVSFSNSYVGNDTFHVYNSSGTSVSIISQGATDTNDAYVSYADSASNFSLTATIGAGTASAPIVILDTASITSALSSLSASYATTGGTGFVSVGTNEYLPLYTNLTLPSVLTTASLVYNVTNHILSMFAPNGTSDPLITLGGTSFPSALTTSEFQIKTYQ